MGEEESEAASSLVQGYFQLYDLHWSSLSRNKNSRMEIVKLAQQSILSSWEEWSISSDTEHMDFAWIKEMFPWVKITNNSI